MKKKFMAGAIAGLMAFGGVGMLSGCGKDDEKLTVIFDADNNANTTNVEQTITDLKDVVYPELPDVNGYAGEWIKKVEDGNRITFIGNYGNGTEVSPYLVKNATQFKKMVEESSALKSTTFYNDQDEEVQEAEATKRTDHYATVDVMYNWTYNSKKEAYEWAVADYVKTGVVYFKLINDVDLDDITTIDATGFVSINIDGAGYKLLNIAEQKLTTGSILDVLVDGAIKNLEMWQGRDCVPLINYVRKGNVTLENLTVNSSYEVSKANNVGPFVCHVLTNATFTMKNCVNNADFVCTGTYSGIFIGGYATNGSNVTFNSCVNNGDFISYGAAGLFFGNNANKPTSYTIINCENNGDFYGNSNVHMLASYSTASGKITADEIGDYDTTVEGQFVQNGVVYNIESSATITADDNQHTIVISDTENLTAGTYEIKLMHTMRSNNGAGEIRFELPITSVVVDGTTNTITLENLYYTIIDKKSYLHLGYTIPQNVEWKQYEDTEYKWYLDTTNGCYVVDTNGIYEHIVEGTSSIDQHRIALMIKDGNGKLIETKMIEKLYPSNLTEKE